MPQLASWTTGRSVKQCLLVLAITLHFCRVRSNRSEKICSVTDSNRDYEHRAEEFEFHKANSLLAGLDMGLLAAAAVVSSPTLADIPAVGAEAIRIAFRTGIIMQERARQLEPQTTGAALESWAVVVRGTSEEAMQIEVQALNDSMVKEPNEL